MATEWAGCSLGALLAHCQLGGFAATLQGRGVTSASQLVVPDEGAVRQLLSEVGMGRGDASELVRAAEALRAEALSAVHSPTQMQLHKPDGSLKHRRWFWVSHTQKTLSWSKKPKAAGKTARVLSTKHVTISHGKRTPEHLGLEVTTGAPPTRHPLILLLRCCVANRRVLFRGDDCLANRRAAPWNS
jgi:hypothetical protein